jgi:flagellar motility protein MotE (MotC chaperone)
MPAGDLRNRVTVLEQKMAGLEELPNRLESVEVRLTGVEGRLTSVESQIVQIRSEMSDGFSALRVEMHDGSRQLAEMIDERFIRQDAEMRRLNDETKSEMRLLNNKTNAQMRVLYEDLKDTIKRIGEAPPL